MIFHLDVSAVLPNLRTLRYQSQSDQRRKSFLARAVWNRTIIFGAAAMLASSCFAVPDNGRAILRTSGQTVISKWKDGKAAVYLISFDDNLPSQLENVVPELIRRKIVGTFYVVTGSPLWAANEQQWVEAARSPYVALANHTFTHEGVNNAEDLKLELDQSNEVLYRVFSDRQQPFLLGFGEPGGVPWNVTEDEQALALKQHNLISRPPFRGSPMNNRTQDELVASVDEAIAGGDMGHNEMHGVGGDYLTTPSEWLDALLDKLESVSEKVWVPDFVTYAKYLAERQNAEVAVVDADSVEIILELTSKVDPTLYNCPLTLTTKVPADWTGAVVTQGANHAEVLVQDGAVRYDALPGAGEIRVARR